MNLDCSVSLFSAGHQGFWFYVADVIKLIRLWIQLLPLIGFTFCQHSMIQGFYKPTVNVQKYVSDAGFSGTNTNTVCLQA